MPAIFSVLIVLFFNVAEGLFSQILLLILSFSEGFYLERLVSRGFYFGLLCE